MTVSRHTRRLVGFAILLGLLLAPLLALAQVTPGPTSVVPVIRGTAAPLPTPCTDGLVRYDTTAGAWKKCSSNAWVSAAGAGTVTSVSGTAPVSVATGTSTPVVSVSAATTGAQGVVQVGTGLSVSSGTVSVAYGTSGSTAAAGNDSRITGALQAANNLSDVAAASTARTNLGLGTAATKNVGTSAGTVAAGDDSRLSDARTPVSHASTHASGGSDPVTLAQSQVTGLAAALAGIPSASSTTPADVGTAAVGTGTTYARADHVHALPDVGAGAGSVGSASQSVSLTTDAKGRVTARSAQSIAIAASQMTSGTIDTARLGSGSASSSTYLRGDSTWATVAGGGATRQAVTTGTTLSGTGDIYADITTLSANLTVTLPAATTAGQRVHIADTTRTAGSAFLVKIAAAGSDTIDGATAIILCNDGGSVTLAADGTSKWKVIGSVGAWMVDPRSISGLLVWFDPARGITTSSNRVSGWADQSGNGKDLSQGTAGSRPYYLAGGPGTRPRLRHTAAEYLNSGSAISYSSGALSAFVVYNRNDWSSTTLHDVLSIDGASDGSAGFALGNSGTAGILSSPDITVWAAGFASAPRATFNNIGSAWFPSTSYPNRETHLIIGELNSTASKIYLDGTDYTSAQGAASVSSITNKILTVGAGTSAGALPHLGDVFDVLVFDAAVSSTNRALLATGLRRKNSL
jgi:hypothetical protein